MFLVMRDMQDGLILRKSEEWATACRCVRLSPSLQTRNQGHAALSACSSVTTSRRVASYVIDFLEESVAGQGRCCNIPFFAVAMHSETLWYKRLAVSCRKLRCPIGPCQKALTCMLEGLRHIWLSSVNQGLLQSLIAKLRLSMSTTVGE